GGDRGTAHLRAARRVALHARRERVEGRVRYVDEHVRQRVRCAVGRQGTGDDGPADGRRDAAVTRASDLLALEALATRAVHLRERDAACVGRLETRTRIE